MSTFSQPGRYSYCIGENEEASPWEPLHVEHGHAAGESTVAVMAAEAPQIVADTRSRTGADLLATIVRSVEVVAHHKATGLGDTALVFSPEHVKTLDDASALPPEYPGWMVDFQNSRDPRGLARTPTEAEIRAAADRLK